MKSGFTLIEFIIGILLFSIIGTALYNSFFVTNRVVIIADTFISKDFRSALLENQFGKDLEGAFIPEEPEQAQQAPAPAKKEEQTKANAPKKETQPKAAESKPPQPFEKTFYSINGAGESLSILSFISNNPVKTYEKATNPEPRIVRIVYRLVPQEKDSKMFTLMRQESTELDFKAFALNAPKPIRAYELANDIKNIKIEYVFPVQKQSQEGGQSQEKPDYKTVKDWDLETNKEAHKEQPKIPQFITITCELWDAQQQHESSFVFNYEIQTFAAAVIPKKSKKAAPAQAQPPATQNPTPTQPAPQPQPGQPAQPTAPQPASPTSTLADLAKISAQLLGKQEP